MSYRVAQDCQEELAEVTAIVEAALEGLGSLTQQDFGAVRAIKQPTPSIKLSMEAICVLRSGKQKFGNIGNFQIS